ncbi:hypothetical protein PR048_012487 [Dryococelus australis]|uniref:Uncharacterized protein n=1 Tax=Dryococelus australis TaxID=614101 RepID=A0ABQ9HPJ4_9NEOP|nr:hypothetical protein PR048_012487 [Dryococelus australis]
MCGSKNSLFTHLRGKHNKHRKSTPQNNSEVKNKWAFLEWSLTSILEQWIELKTHFQFASGDLEKFYMTRVLNEMYKDYNNLLYLLFLKPVTKEISQTNLLFQADSTESTKLFEEPCLLLLYVAWRLINQILFVELGTSVQNTEYFAKRIWI